MKIEKVRVTRHGDHLILHKDDGCTLTLTGVPMDAAIGETALLATSEGDSSAGHMVNLFPMDTPHQVIDESLKEAVAHRKAHHAAYADFASTWSQNTTALFGPVLVGYC